MGRSCIDRICRRWLAAGLAAGVPLLGLGCGSSLTTTRHTEPAPVPQQFVGRNEINPENEGSELRLAAYQEATKEAMKEISEGVTESRTTQAARGSEPIRPPLREGVRAGTAHKVPITLDTVFRLAEHHNPKISLAREKLNESNLGQVNGYLRWLPNVYAGIAYYRHEGGIQDFSGRLLHSSTQALYPALNLQSEIDLRDAVFKEIDTERKIWQHKAELSQVNNEVLLEAATTYVDLLTARSGLLLAQEIEGYERKLLERVEKLARADRSAEALRASVRAVMNHRQLLQAKLRYQAEAATAKLVYLLGLPPETCLEPVDLVFVPIELVDSTPPACDLVARALTSGPGIRELQGILRVVDQAMLATTDVRNLLPSVQFNLAEGPFGAGPGGSLAWDNRLDMGVQLRWNISQLLGAEHHRSLIRSKQQQAALSYQEVCGKLAAGVKEARNAIIHGREQIGLAMGQVSHASESYQLNNRRMEESVEGASPGDVLLSIRSLEQAHFGHLQAISDHNKAQIRLLLLLGPQEKPANGRVPGPVPVAVSTPTEVHADPGVPRSGGR